MPSISSNVVAITCSAADVSAALCQPFEATAHARDPLFHNPTDPRKPLTILAAALGLDDNIPRSTNFSAPTIFLGSAGFETTGVAANRGGNAPESPVKKMKGTARRLSASHTGSASSTPTRKSSTPQREPGTSQL